MGRPARSSPEALGVKPITLLSRRGRRREDIGHADSTRPHIDKFDVLHTSTYAEDDYSSGISLKALMLLMTRSWRVPPQGREALADCAG
jgi:hypothetical protein